MVSDLLIQVSLLYLWDFPRVTELLWGLGFLCKKRGLHYGNDQTPGESLKINRWALFPEDSELVSLKLDLTICIALNLIMKMSPQK